MTSVLSTEDGRWIWKHGAGLCSRGNYVTWDTFVILSFPCFQIPDVTLKLATVMPIHSHHDNSKILVLLFSCSCALDQSNKKIYICISCEFLGFLSGVIEVSVLLISDANLVTGLELRHPRCVCNNKVWYNDVKNTTNLLSVVVILTSLYVPYLIGNWYPMFRGHVLVSFSRVEMSKSSLPGHYSETQLHITEGMRPQIQSNLNAK